MDIATLRTRVALVIVVALAAIAAGSVVPVAAADPAPTVIVAEVDSIIHPVSSEFMLQVMDRADTANAAAVIFVLRTPGGLLDSTQAIVSRLIVARTPVVVFVAPAGARAASAGFILVVSSDVAAMAAGTHIGAAHPVSGSGAKLSDTVEKKAASDVAAYVRSLAAARHRNVQLSEEAVTESRAFTDSEALSASPPLIDLDRGRCRRSRPQARWTDRDAIRRPQCHGGHARSTHRADRDVHAAESAERDRASAGGLHPHEPRAARAHSGDVEPRVDPAWRRGRRVAAARVLRAAGAAGEHGGLAAPRIRGRPARSSS